MIHSKTITFILALFIRVFANYDTIDFSGNTAQFRLINNSNTSVTVDTVKLFKLENHNFTWSMLVVFDTATNKNGDAFRSPYRYGTGSYNSGKSLVVFTPQENSTVIKIKKKDTLTIHQSCQAILYANALEKKENVGDYMGMVFIRSDKKNDSIIVKLNLIATGHVKTAKQATIKNNKIVVEYLINGKKMEISHRANMMIIRNGPMISRLIFMNGH